MKGVYLAELTYDEAQKYLNEDTVIVLPLGGGSKEHGRHLPMGTDMYCCQALTEGLTERAPVVTLPMMAYEHFPAFITWEGSITIEADHFIKLIKDICRTFVKCGVKRFLLLDFSFSGFFPIACAANEISNEMNVKVAVSRFAGMCAKSLRELEESKQDGHAGEFENSVILYTHPELVRTDRYEEEYRQDIEGVRVDGAQCFYVSNRMETPHGVNGHPAMGNAEKGKIFVEESVDTLCRFVETFRNTPIDMY